MSRITWSTITPDASPPAIPTSIPSSAFPWRRCPARSPIATEYAAQLTPASTESRKNLRRGNPDAPVTRLTATRPTGTYRADIRKTAGRLAIPRPAESSAARIRGRRIHTKRVKPTFRPMAKVRLSPAIAPTAAHATTSAMFGCPTETAAAAAAMTIDSLGTGGKNASMSTASTITIGIHGVETTAAMKSSLITTWHTKGGLFQNPLPPFSDCLSSS